MSEGVVYRIQASNGGVPKRAIDEGRITRGGLEGDTHAKPGIHGGPDQALCLYSLEWIEAIAREGHPISPGSTGENLTLRGIDWAGLSPGARLRLGRDVVVQVTGFAAPCRTIAGSFADGRYGRIAQTRSPGRSRLYARVLAEGTIRPGDPVVVESAASAEGVAPRPDGSSGARVRAPEGGSTMEIAYVNVYVTDLERSVAFFEGTLGLGLQFADAQFGYASFDAGPIRIGLAQIDAEDPDARALTGRQTGVGFAVPDLDARYAKLKGAGVAFPMPPSKQPWGGYMALFADPDGNVFYLDQIAEG